MSDTALADGLKKQYDEALTLLAGAMGTLTPEQWQASGPPYTPPGRAAAHALECAEFYTSRDRTIFGRFGEGVWQMADEDVPDQDALGVMRRALRQAAGATVS